MYGELGRYPISISVKLRMVKFWCRLVNSNENKFSAILYKLLYINLNNYGFANMIIAVYQMYGDHKINFLKNGLKRV